MKKLTDSFKPGSKLESPIAVPLQMVWFLSVLVFLINYTFEVLAFNHLFASQSFLLALLQSSLSIWAIVEVLIGMREQTFAPLGPLKVALVAQFLVGAVRYPIGQFVNADSQHVDEIARNLEFGLATIFVPAYLILFLIIGKIVIDAFAYLERQRAELLAAEIGVRIRAEEAAAQANAALQAANARLSQLATTDPLTGLWNRRHLEEMLAAEVAKSRRYQTPLALLILDLDHFKSINDRHGHAAGDSVLKEATRLFKHELRETDLLARWGGEEFVVLVPHCSAAGAVALAEKLRLVVASHVFAEVGSVTISVGASELKSEESIDDWFRRVDGALYEAKSGGRNTVRLAA